MYARAVCKGIAPTMALFGLHRHAHLRAYHAANIVNSLRLNIGVQAEAVMGFQDHHHFFYRGVAGAFADAVDGAFYLACAILQAGDGVGGGKAQIVMTVHGNNGLVDIFYIFFQETDFALRIGQAGSNRWCRGY